VKIVTIKFFQFGYQKMMRSTHPSTHSNGQSFIQMILFLSSIHENETFKQKSDPFFLSQATKVGFIQRRK
jgi:hypothetical protein